MPVTPSLCGDAHYFAAFSGTIHPILLSWVRTSNVTFSIIVGLPRFAVVERFVAKIIHRSCLDFTLRHLKLQLVVGRSD